MKSDRFLTKSGGNLDPTKLRKWEDILREALAENELSLENFHLFLRAFKAERQLEIWLKSANESNWHLYKNIPFCNSSGVLGPKRKEGDRQIPEGFYHIVRFNPKSKYHLSLGLNYPNRSDRLLGHPTLPGSDIFIHGGCETVGCIPVTDEGIEAIYVLAGWAIDNGQANIPVHIFPFRFTAEKWNQYKPEFPQHFSFWRQLEAIYLAFEINKQLPEVLIHPDGKYGLSF